MPEAIDQHPDPSAPDDRLVGATPVMAQYLRTKQAHPDALLFFRMGDFYELFFEDAVTVSGALNLALTKRGKHQGEDIAMAGVPAHAADAYMAKLIRMGHRVCVCDQLEDPAEAKKRGSKSVVKRGVVRIMTPGTLTEDSLLEARGLNRLAAISRVEGQLSLASLDLSCGLIESMALDQEQLLVQLGAMAPSETLIIDTLWADTEFMKRIKPLGGVCQPQARSLGDVRASRERLMRLYGVQTLDGFGHFSNQELSALGLLAAYIELTQVGRRPVLKPPRQLGATRFLSIDPQTRASLEIERSTRGERQHSLMGVLDHCATPGGSRLLLERLSRPLCDVDAINDRLDCVDWFGQNPSLAQSLRSSLSGLPDMVRALSRLGLGRGGPRDMANIRQGLALGPILRAIVTNADGRGLSPDLPQPLMAACDALALNEGTGALLDRLTAALTDELPLNARDGGFIRPDYNTNLNAISSLKTDATRIVLELEASLQARSGLSLRIKYNAILGYFIETTQKQSEQLSLGPLKADLIHRQTLANQIRSLTTVELMDLDSRINRAASEALALELTILRGPAPTDIRRI